MADNPILAHTRVAAAGREPEKWLLMLHGIFGAGRNWGTIARRLADARPEWGAVLVDLRNHGQSRDFSGPHSLAESAADVDRLVEHLDLHATAVVGHSFGGKVALMYGEEHGAELRQIWVMDSTMAVREPSGSAWEMIETAKSLPADFASRDEAVQGLMRGGYDEAVARWMAINLEPVEGRYRWRIDFTAMEEMLRDFFRTDLWHVVDSPPAGVEVHVVKATRSSALDPEAAGRVRSIAAASRSVYLHELEGGHWINTDNPEGVLKLLVDLLP